ncbi:MAG: alpha-glucosidase/alpha-galactosidase [Oceanipulchritudo sp.]
MKIAFIGAGSVGFTRKLVADLLTVPEFHDVEFAFTDINKRSLEMVTALVRRDIRANGLRTRIRATTNRRLALKDANYVFCVVRVGGLEAFRTDIEIPLQYGIDQCVGDTLCAGGLMYAQRGIAAMLDFCRDIREVAAPDCLLMNYANPMAMMTWAANAFGGVRCVGLCHGVQHGHWQIAEVLGAKQEEVDIVCAGINHQTWYLDVRLRGEKVAQADLLAAFERHPEFSKTEKVRLDMFRRFGHYSTESNGHLSEYVPWYRKRPREIRRWIDLSEWIHGETGGYLRVCTEGRDWFEQEFGKGVEAIPALEFTAENRTQEHGSYIIEAMEAGRPYCGHFNLRNDSTITNLPADAIVEAPGYVDRHGFNRPQLGDLPPGCAAVCSNSIGVQRLGVLAAVKGDDELLRQAFLLDPLVGAVCNPPEVWQLVDEMLIAGEPWLPQYGAAIAAARKRLKAGPRIPTKPAPGVRPRPRRAARPKANPREGH